MRIAASPRGAFCYAGLLVAATLAAILAGCATPPNDPAERAAFEQNNDPLEPLNREILDANLFVDRILLKPATQVYTTIVPEEGRDAFRRVLDNMKEPIVVFNNVLQGEVTRAGNSAGRFVVNSTVGLAGLLDVAGKLGLGKETGDFGQTLFAWGFPEGPYLMLPVLGPSNPRDVFGMVADNYMDPFSFLASTKAVDELQIARFVGGGLDERARVSDILDDLQKNSLDFYAQLRSLAQQRRAAELRHGAASAPASGFYQDPNAAPVTGGSSPATPPPASTPPLSTLNPSMPVAALQSPGRQQSPRP